MGQVALTAGYYLMSKLPMHEAEPISSRDLFDVEYVQIKDGLVSSGPPPKSRVFLWNDAAHRRDVLVFIGEAQPPTGKLAFCTRLLDHAQRLGVREVFTFAAMATDSTPHDAWRVFGVSTAPEGLDELRRRKVEIMAQGQITGLNGVFLAAAAERGIRGTGLLGEMPAFAAQVPFPKASLHVLDVFTQMAGISIDMRELDEYARAMDRQLTQILERVQKALQQQQQQPPEDIEEEEPELTLESAEATDEDRRRIEELFLTAQKDRSRTFELKRELDRLGVFKEYENRFLDLFRKPE